MWAGAIGAPAILGMFWVFLLTIGMDLGQAALAAVMMFLMLAGSLSLVYGYFTLVISAFRDGSLWWGLGLIFLAWLCIPLFAIVRWRAAWKPFLFFASGVLAWVVALLLSGLPVWQ
jgi:hypothetical protein